MYTQWDGLKIELNLLLPRCQANYTNHSRFIFLRWSWSQAWSPRSFAWPWGKTHVSPTQSRLSYISLIDLNCAVAHVKKKRKNYIQGAYISANTYSRETISTGLAWQEASNNMRLKFFLCLVHEKIDILGEILTRRRVQTNI